MSSLGDLLARRVRGLSAERLPRPVRRAARRVGSRSERVRRRANDAWSPALRAVATLLALVISVGAAFAVGYAVADAVGGGTTTTGSPNEPPSTPPASRSPATSPAETPAEFVDRLAAAFRTGDSAFLLERLNPAVLRRYGDAECRSYTATLHDPTRQFGVRQVPPPAPYVWASDDRSVTVPGTLALTVAVTSQGQTTEQVIHVTGVGDRYTWFTDCGTATGP